MPKDEKEDPWHAMEAELETAARAMLDIREKFQASLKDQSSDAQTPSADSSKRTAALLAQLESAINDMEPDVAILKNSLEAAVENPERCKVSAAELQRRQDVCQYINKKLQLGKHDVTAGHRAEERRRIASQQGLVQQASTDESSKFMQTQFADQKRAQEISQAALARIDHSLKGVENKANLIGNALTDQDKDLDALNKDMTKVQIKMDGAIKKVDDMLNRTSDRGKIGIIVALMIILVVLCVVLFSGNSADSGSN